MTPAASGRVHRRINPRCAAELAPRDHADILVEAPRMKIVDECGDPLIESVQLNGKTLKVPAVPVPAAEGEGDAADTRFDQSSSHQELIHPVRPGVFAERG